MKICGIQKVSLVDYPQHVATTIFTSGCNFACPFCHNAGLVKNEEPVIDTNYILDYLSKRKNVIDGVCISGGEPTLQPDLEQFIITIKQMGFLVKLDTNGTNINLLKRLVDNKLLDYIAMDIKNSPSKYPLTAQYSHFDNLQEVVEYIMTCGVPYEFRTTLVQGHHTLEDIISIGNLIRNADNYYLQKFEDSGNCLTSGLSPIDHTTAETYLNTITQYVKNAQLRGY